MKPMNVVLTADPYLPVPPRLYGGIERIIDLIARGLHARGHRVTLVAHPDSSGPARLVPYGVPPHRGFGPRARELWQVWRALFRDRTADVVHSFGRLGGLLPILPMRRLPKVQSYQRDVEGWSHVRVATRLASDSIAFTGCSARIYRQREQEGEAGGRWLRIFNGVELARYQLAAEVAPDAPLGFLGRLERIKGVHSAIAIARQAGRRLVLAGNRVDDGGEPDYFDREIAPHLDGDRVRWIGTVDDVAKNDFLRGVAALLLPVECEDAFPIVMPEAFACGTPVIGFARGGLPEGIVDGKNGFLCTTVDEGVRAVARLAEIDRRAVRSDCEARFSDRVIVDQYEALYREMVDRCAS
jgi:glycosyltransferase involved in cell wall biosynthesis